MRPLFFTRARSKQSLENAVAASAVAAFLQSERVREGTPLFVALDQTKLPEKEVYLCTDSWQQVVLWIKQLVVRGAPAIGCAGACACALAAYSLDGERLDEALNTITSARPTAVNLSWAVSRMKGVLSLGHDAAFAEASRIMAEDEAANRAIGAHGVSVVPNQARILTHCNAGSLATSFYGTALGVVYAAAEKGILQHVYADETRPVGQGARLTVWELAQAGVPVTLICDNMAASLMAQGAVDVCIVGADRIAANGDVANKIGTLSVALAAEHFGIPFYIAAPVSTIDASCADGSCIEIEERGSNEVLVNPIQGVKVWNPAFDVTPASLISGIITERGIYDSANITKAIS